MSTHPLRSLVILAKRFAAGGARDAGLARHGRAARAAARRARVAPLPVASPATLLATLLATFLATSLATLPATARAADELAGEPLVRALRGGGFNVYFRHAQTDWSLIDRVRAPQDWESCDPTRLRQLSEQGRAAARAVGEAVRALGIPVARVLASPYCRTMETARLLGLGPVTATTEVMNLRAAEFFGGRDAIVASARRRLATPPPPGSNIVIVAHGNVAREATPVYPGEAEGVVFAPDGAGGFRPVARLDPDRWRALAAAFGDR